MSSTGLHAPSGRRIIAGNRPYATVLVDLFPQRAANFAISNPARELLFTVVDREEKYKAKYVIDNVVFRGGDAASGWLFHALRGLGMEPSSISLATVPVALGWLAIALALGRTHEKRTVSRISTPLAEK